MGGRSREVLAQPDQLTALGRVLAPALEAGQDSPAPLGPVRVTPAWEPVIREPAQVEDPVPAAKDRAIEA